MAVPTVDEEYLKQIRKARSDLLDIIKANNCAPILLRLAFHDAGTYDPKTNSGGPNGSIRNEKELNHTANKGLEIAVDFCEQVKKNNPNITYADLYQLAGVVAVEATGGPRIEFVPGRKDSLESPEEGRLPSSKLGAQHLRDIFYRMGFTDRDIVALSGAHTLGSAHKDRSDYAGSWTRDPYKFDNSYFGELLKEETKDLLRLPTDKALLDDPSFKGFVELYAKDEAAFFRDYRKAHKKLSELGFIHQTAQNNTLLTQSIVIVAVATVLVVFSYFFEVQRRVR